MLSDGVDGQCTKFVREIHANWKSQLFCFLKALEIFSPYEHDLATLSEK